MSSEMTASLRRRPSSPAAVPPLEDGDLLAEILLRLPPLPSSIPRASAVSKRWRGLASDPRFIRRFRLHHRRNPPLLGCFVEKNGCTHFQPVLEAPDRVPPGRFSFPIDAGNPFQLLECRHGLVLSLLYPRTLLLVWDPLTGDQHRLHIPPGFDMGINSISAAVFCTDGDVSYFKVVLVGTSYMQHAHFVASVYSSETCAWGNLITATVSPQVSGDFVLVLPPVLVGDSLYWLITGNSLGILQFDLGRHSLGLIPMPSEGIITDGADLHDILVIMPEGGCLGFLLLSGFNAQLWKRKTNSDGVASWVLGRTIALDELLSINSEDAEIPSIRGFAEHNNLVLLSTSIGIFTVQLESLQFKKLFDSKDVDSYYPFEGVYAEDKNIDGGPNGAELPQNK